MNDWALQNGRIQDAQLLLDNMGEAVVIVLGIAVATYILVAMFKGIMAFLIKMAAIVFCVWIIYQAYQSTNTGVSPEGTLEHNEYILASYQTLTGERA